MHIQTHTKCSACRFWSFSVVILLWVHLNGEQYRQTLTHEVKKNVTVDPQLANRNPRGHSRKHILHPGFGSSRTLMWADFHAGTVCSCQCMSNSSPRGSALLAVMNSSQEKQVKLHYLLSFKTRQSINEEHHWLISVEWCLILPLFSCPLPVMVCKSLSRN